MDGQRFKLTGGPFRQVGQQREGEEVTIPLAEAHLDFSVKDSVEDFRLPINHRPVENLIIDDLEQASLDTQLTSSNIGYRLLQKMGWKGKGLGKDEQGIVEPIKAGIRDPKLGVGKQEQDDFFTAEENVQRRRLEVELEETEELAKKREVIAEREQKIQTEVKEIKKVFFCNLCNKQYKLAVEFEAHLSSYDHNHRKRFKEMRDMRASSSRDDRQKKEQLRQEKEVAKFAAQMADARRRQHEQLQEQSEVPTDSSKGGNATPVNDQRQTLKFGFTSKLGSTKNPAATAAKKAKIAVKVTSVFGNDSDEES
ncbi:G patch domain-containing protein 8 isoform X5 [Dendrobium catenatum]|uniref:G patch domain-containing protein 8 isoform X5 n=1 Tax=Dendrobium catenatum TaxID=906689 RepID=UPI0009F718BB|nr:G patch domain-containing protein 8 isoform X5 [Dendrobium catenatum]